MSDYWKEYEPWKQYAIHDDKQISGFFGPYRFLSNFWAAPVEYKGVRFESTEAAYQAAKATTPEDFQKFVGLGMKESKQLGNQIKKPTDWEKRRLSIMEYLVFQKFSRHAQLRQQLLETDNKFLFESNHWRDRFWGIHYAMNNDFKYVSMGGENHLGLILTRVRQALRP